ncbi:MAG TPA: glycosyltransferase family 4 protein [Bacteroides xylanisolvens]|uniref:Glycosyltransferase family 4 protein n=1 Tax=Bacteroides xylanisolvens TaxID=371601 RepID=A0A921LGC8_9BACE|nr:MULTISPECIES: glycosyltransferase family 4 protein [Bacteroides]HJG11708.1 glycosyltransferase family 4 protein [Bacteroides xylanisolvens]
MKKIIGYVSVEDPFRDKKAWSGTKYKIREAIQNAGYEVIWISCKPSKVYFIILKILLKTLFGKKAIVEHNKYYLKLCARSINMEKVRLCDYIFFPGGAQISEFIKFEKPIIYYTDANFHIMIDYYWYGLSSWLLAQGEYYEKRAIENSFINIRSSQWAADSVVRDYGGNSQRNYILEFGANLEDKDLLHTASYEKGTLNILFSGVDWIRKGGEVAVKTVQLLNKRGISSCLFIVGLSEIPQKYANLPFVRMIGFLDKNNLEHYQKYVDIMKSSHLLLLPTHAECAGIVFCESSAFGLPIFTYNTGGTGNYVIDGVNGYKLPLTAREKEFADTIEKTLKSGEFFQLHNGGITLFNERLSWATWSKRFRKIMEENNL